MNVIPMELMDAKQVAQILGMSPHWIYREAKAGRIPCVKLGRKIKFVRKVIEAWIARIGNGDTAAI